MINGLGYKLANVPTVTGLSSVVADSIISGTTNTSQLFINGVDVSTTLSQVPINTNNITLLQTATTGITYSNAGSIDLTTIDNNVTVTTGKKLKIATAPTANEDVVNKLYCDTAIANLVDSAPATLDTLNELAAALGDDPNYATTTATLIGGKASLASGPQTITAGTTMSSASNVFYGNGANLTGITTSAITTTTLPASGTYYPTLTDSSTGASSRVPYTTNQIYYDRNNNKITLPNIDSFGQLRMTSTDQTQRQIFTTFYNFLDNSAGASPSHTGRIYTTLANNYYSMFDPSTVFTFLFGLGTVPNPFITPFVLTTTALNISVPTNFTSPLKMTNTDWNKRQIYNTIYNIMDGDGSAGGTLGGQIFYANPYVYIELTTGRKFQIRINAVNVFDVDSTAVNCSVPISSTSTVSGATLQTSGNIYLTNSSAYIQTSTAGSDLSVGTQSGGGLFLNANGITGIRIVGTGIDNYLPTIIETNIVANLPSLKIKQTASTQAINFTPFAPLGTSNPITNADSSVISVGGGGTTRRFVLTTDSVTTVGIRMSDVAIVIGAGGTANNPLHRIGFSDSAGINISSNIVPVVEGYTLPAGTDSSTKIATTAWVQSAITSGATNYMTLDTPQTVALAGQKTFTNSIVVTGTTNFASLTIVASSSLPRSIFFLAGVTPTTSFVDIVFGNANNTKSCVSIINPNTTNDGGIFLQAGNGGYLYGRNDGNAFNTQTSGNGSSVALLYPIGFCFDIAPVSTKPVSVTALTTNASIALTKGVWQISGYIFINRSNGTFVADSNVKVVYPTVAGLTIYPNASGLQMLIPHTNTSLIPMNLPIGAITVVCTTAGAILTAERTIKMTVGTTTTWSITFSGVKIA